MHILKPNTSSISSILISTLHFYGTSRLLTVPLKLVDINSEAALTNPNDPFTSNRIFLLGKFCVSWNIQ